VCKTQKLHPPIRPKNPTTRKNRVSSLQCARVVKGRGAQTRCSPLPITSVRHRRRRCSARAADDRRAKPQVSMHSHNRGVQQLSRHWRQLGSTRRRRCRARVTHDRRATQGERAWSCDGAYKTGLVACDERGSHGWRTLACSDAGKHRVASFVRRPHGWVNAGPEHDLSRPPIPANSSCAASPCNADLRADS
jgi:hypothetical protein